MNDDEPVVIEAVGGQRASVIWLHGLGADGHDFVPVVPELRLPPALGIRFIFPHAPVRPVTINSGMRMRAWYDIRELSVDRGIDPAEIHASCDLVRGLIAEEQDRGIAPDRILLAGFSQGAAIALQTGLSHPEPLAGILGLSGYLPLQEEIGNPPAGLPVFLGHGQFDGIVPVKLGEMTLQALRDMGLEPDWQTYPMDHGVCPQEIADIGAWIGNLFRGR